MRRRGGRRELGRSETRWRRKGERIRKIKGGSLGESGHGCDCGINGVPVGAVVSRDGSEQLDMGRTNRHPRPRVHRWYRISLFFFFFDIAKPTQQTSNQKNIYIETETMWSFSESGSN